MSSRQVFHNQRFFHINKNGISITKSFQKFNRGRNIIVVVIDNIFSGLPLNYFLFFKFPDNFMVRFRRDRDFRLGILNSLIQGAIAVFFSILYKSADFRIFQFQDNVKNIKYYHERKKYIGILLNFS